MSKNTAQESAFGRVMTAKLGCFNGPNGDDIDYLNELRYQLKKWTREVESKMHKQYIAAVYATENEAMESIKQS